MLRLKLSDISFTRLPIENIGFINPKYYSLVDEGHPIVEIRGSEMRGVSEDSVCPTVLQTSC